MKKLMTFLMLFLTTLWVSCQDQKIPISTQWMLQSAGTYGNENIRYSFFIACPETNSAGSGFLISSGYIITNAHVIQKNVPSKVFAVSALGQAVQIDKIVLDTIIDIAILKPKSPLIGGLSLKANQNNQIGEFVYTFGYPLGYQGPSPILTTGYLSGYNALVDSTNNRIIKHLIINGAFNPGNSGGALVAAKSNEIIGVVISKHAPITKWILDIIDALSSSKSGFMYSATDNLGNQIQFTEAQLVANVLSYFRNMTQTVIGEAIIVDDLIYVLKKNNITY